MRLFRIFFSSAVFIFAATLAFSAPDPLFHEANVKYEAGDYKTALSLYRKIVESGKGGAAAYYNLGNAYFRTGDKGHALAAYERAHALNPRDRDIEWNKGILVNSLPDRIEDAGDNVFFSSVDRLLEWITIDETALLFSLFLGGLFLVSLGHFLARRKGGSLTAGTAGFFLLLCLVSGGVFYAKWRAVRDPHAVILDKEVAARYGPSDKETKAFVLHEGAEAKVIDSTGDWYYILLKNNTTGWILKKTCEII